MTKFNRAFFVASVLFSGALAHADKFVIIGDSLSCGPFGIQLVRNLATQGHTGTLYCAVSATPDDWLLGKVPPASDGCHTLNNADLPHIAELCPNPNKNTRVATYVTRTCFKKMPTLAQIIKHEGAASHYIVALGTNSLGNGAIDATYGEFLNQIKNVDPVCTWISPPHCRPDQVNPRVFNVRTVTLDEANLDRFTLSLESYLKNNSRCELVDSRPLTQKENNPLIDAGETMDGVHRTNCSGKIWADKTTL